MNNKVIFPIFAEDSLSKNTRSLRLWIEDKCLTLALTPSCNSNIVASVILHMAKLGNR